MMKFQFESGEGRHFAGAVNYLISTDRSVYAECSVPNGASEDYGYIALKNAILGNYQGAEELSFWYDGQEQFLSADACAECEVYVEVD